MNRKSAIFIAVLTAAMAAWARRPELGVCAHVTWDEFAELDRTVDMCAAAGFRWIRCDFEWSAMQKERGGPFDFAHFDVVVDAARRRGLTILPILAGPPEWAKPITGHLDEWREFVRAVVSHFGSRLPAVEIWNEENLETFWPNVNAADYVRVLSAAAAAARGANPKVEVVLGGLSNVPLDYLRDLYAAGGKPHFDVMNVHPYSWPYPPEGDKSGSAGLKEDIRNLRRFMASQGDADKPIWITEHGWPTHRAKLPEVLSLLAGLKLANSGREVWRMAYACLGEPTEAERQLAAEMELALPKGSSVEACSPLRLNERLSGGSLDAVVYPFSEAFPMETADAVVDFVSRGGTLVDFGGFPMFYPCHGGEFAGSPNGWSEEADKVRQRLRIGLSAHWMDAALPDSLMAQPTDAARDAGLVGDPRGFYVYRFFTAERLRDGDRMIPLLVGRDKRGRPAVGACVYKFGSDMKGAVVVSCRGNLVRAVSEKEQADYLKRSIDISADCGVERYFIYEFRAPELDPYCSEYHFGIVHSDFSPKPAYRMLAGKAKAKTLLDEVVIADHQADAAVAAIRMPEELKAKQIEWRAAWLDGIGGLPETKTPLNAKVGPIVKCDGFTLQNVLFESQPGVYVTGHLALPASPQFKPPYACVMMPLGHSDAGILNPRYAAHFAMTARAGLAAFAWDPISQGERRQSSAKYDYTDNCSTEHTRLGVRGWLVGWNFARFEIWDAIRAVDYVLTRTEIDGSRLGVMGTSGGGTMSAYMQALDDRIAVAFPNCFISSIRAVFGDRGCHDAEQFFFGQLTSGVNHAAILAMGCPRVALATGSRWKDYFPHAGAVGTFAVFTNMVAGLRGCGVAGLRDPWHFSCDGPHGLPTSTRAAQTDWMRHHLLGVEAPRSLAEYRTLDPGPEPKDDPSNRTGYPFDTNDTFFTPTHQVRDLPGFKSVYSLIADRARELKSKRTPKTRGQLREIVRRRAGIRPLENLSTFQPFDFSTSFNWWYLKGPWGYKAENKAAILATLGRSYVGEQAEEILRKASADVAANGGEPVVLRAKGWDCIAAAHASVAEPQLFSGIDFTDRPPSWTELVTNPDPKNDSFAVGVWGALVDYDWVDLVE